jgi:hypothetical protein
MLPPSNASHHRCHIHQHSLPPPRSHQGPSLFELLPLHLTQDILQRAGPRSRLLCKGLANLYGSLPSLTPRGLTRNEDLPSALLRLCRHRELTTLDLTRAPDLVTDSNLEVICKALPHIQQLHLPVTTFEVTAARRLAAQQTLLPSLTALHVSGPSALPFPPSPWRSFDVERVMELAPLSQLRELTLPASTAYHVSTHAEHLPKLTVCSRLTFSDHLNHDVDSTFTEHMVICAQHLPALVSLVIDVRERLLTFPQDLRQLQGFTMLTELQVGTIRFCNAARLIGAVTGLQSLRLRLLSEAWRPLEDSCLARLSLLTSLHVVALGRSWPLYPHVDHQLGDRLLAAVPHLPPSLQDLQLTISSSNGRYSMVGSGPTTGAFAGLASASSVLQLLDLMYLKLPGNFMEVIQQLTRLTTLGIHDCNCTAAGSFAGLTALTSLRKLALCDLVGGSTAGCSSIEGMKQLHTLQLYGSFVDGPYLARLCAALPQLQVLDISGCHSIASGMSALGLLTALEVVDLSDTVGVHQLERYLSWSPSLRRCHLSYLQPWKQQRAAALLGPLVEVVFN